MDEETRDRVREAIETIRRAACLDSVILITCFKSAPDMRHVNVLYQGCEDSECIDLLGIANTSIPHEQMLSQPVSDGRQRLQ